MKSATETQFRFITKERDLIIDILKKNNYKITGQRNVIITTILENDCNTVKDIYFESVKKDKSIGIATVYRMVRILEELDILKANTIDINHECVNCHKQDTIVYVNESDTREIILPKWLAHIKKELKRQGLLDNEKISIVIRKSCDGVQQCNGNCTGECAECNK